MLNGFQVGFMVRSLLFITLFFLGGCVSFFEGGKWDERGVSLFYASLYNQKNQGYDYKSWSGDWFFRRERLFAVDAFLRDRKPDLVIFQEALARKGDLLDSDEKILGRGGLSGYEWGRNEVAFYEDTHELEYHLVASGLPLQPVSLPPSAGRYWPLAGGGHLSFFLMELFGNQIPIFQVEIRGDRGHEALALSFVSETVLSVLSKYQFCPYRMLLVGRMPFARDSEAFAAFLETLSLKEALESPCETASECETGSMDNELFARGRYLEDGLESVMMDRVLVHKEALVLESSMELKEPIEDNSFEADYGLKKVWPLERYGLYSHFKLSQCAGR